MAISELFSGTEDVVGTEWSCTTDTAGPDTETSDCEAQLYLDLADQAAGETLQVRLYEKDRAADTQRLVQEWIISGAQASPIWVSPVFILLHGWDFTLKALAGTITVNFSIRGVTSESSSIAAIKAKTDSLTFTVAGQVDANIQSVNDVVLTGGGVTTTDEWRPV